MDIRLHALMKVARDSLALFWVRDHSRKMALFPNDPLAKRKRVLSVEVTEYTTRDKTCGISSCTITRKKMGYS